NKNFPKLLAIFLYAFDPQAHRGNPLTSIQRIRSSTLELDAGALLNEYNLVKSDLEGENKDGERDESIASPNKKLKEDIKTIYSDLSRPPGFEFMKKTLSSTSKLSTSFASHRKSDIKGVSLINELNQIIKVGTALGYDVRGCKKTLNIMINGIGIHLVDK
nr:RNA-directed DNA polymerase, eukaryota, reverse transcriptase zinc-binding domain protein [Tanacetum cinerariifolium]